MRRLFTTILYIAILAAFTVSAETVSQKEAKRIATQFFNAAHGQVMAEPKLVYNGRRLTTNSLFPPFYLYNHPAGGFVVISAENKAFPVLGYDLSANFDADKVQPVTKALLRLYALHIENVRYDSSIPFEAEAAWADIPHYIDALLNAEYKATDPRTTMEEAQGELDLIEDMDDPSAFTSEVYSPDQWQESLNMELDSKGEAVLGIVGPKGLVPVIVHGRKGDYYRMELDGRNSSLWRLLPTEILSQGEVAMLGNPGYVPEPPVMEEPHRFYEEFVGENEARRQAEARAIEETLMPTEPQVKGHGGGHFTVSFPNQVNEMRVYALDGTLAQRDKFRDTNTAVIDLSSCPVGFYFAVFFTSEGYPYSLKLFR